MKDGFETLKDTIDLAQYSMKGYLGVFVYILIGAAATIIIQSSSATMAIIVTALASSQVLYTNALALAIGANIGTTVWLSAVTALTRIQKGDIIKSINGVKISKFSDLKGFLNTKSPDDVVEVTLNREGEIKIVNVTLERLTTINVPIIGTLKELSSSELKSKDSDYGLLLQELSNDNKEDWVADGVDEGSLIVAINDIKVNSISDVKKALSEYSNRVLRLTVIKNNGEKMAYRFR